MAASQDLRGSRYRSNGSAAYDIRTYGNAVPKPRGPGLPEERPRPVRRQRVKAKTAVSPFAALGLVAAALMLVMVIFSYVQLYEATSEVGRLQEELAALQEEQQALTSQYEGQIDLAAIETRARELGMVQPTSIETVYLNLTSADRAEVLGEQSPGFLASVFRALRGAVESLVSYLS